MADTAKPSAGIPLSKTPAAEAPQAPAPDGEAVPELGGEAVPELGGQKGPEPTRFGDWEKGGRCTDF
jgi:hypothetical protein